MITWQLLQFRNVVNSFLSNCESRIHDVLSRRLTTLLEHGSNCRRPVSSSLKGGFFELIGKTKTKEARLIYYFKPEGKIVFVHALYKTTRAIPRHDMKIAERNKKIIEEEGGKIDGVTYTH